MRCSFSFDNEANLNEQSQEFLESLRSERRDLLTRLRQTQFSTLKAGYSQFQVVPHATYAPWRDDSHFEQLYSRLREYTLVDVYRCYELYYLARQSERVAGDLVEVGVWRGGTGAILAAALPRRRLHLFDTFQGVVKADSRFDTKYQGGEHADADREAVLELFSSLGLSCDVHVGVFPDDTREGLPDATALAHVDVDTYSSAKESFYAIWPTVQQGGVVVFDDYGFWGCEGVAQAVNELRQEVPDALFVHNLNGHALMFKANR